ncbi:UNVERIFIED_CONTAM: hypothetical protein PYX00_004726 [Menopon gallinae]|uniref:Beta-1,4-N-acetylgalactosaminyltransferase n=1 Tax=Menopon gallinae TaxID=328185 RepID=A0AAW2I5L6_9NEOP
MMFLREKLNLIIYSAVFFIIVFLCLFILPIDECNCPTTVSSFVRESLPREDYTSKRLIKHTHKLGVLVPFRDRFNELLEFAPYMTDFLERQSVHHQIYILNQVDNYRFNRASLINVGFKFAKNECDYVAMHDVDLLPLNDQLKYFYPSIGAYHISSPSLHPKYHYPTFVGGILIIKREDFEQVNGMSNKYWGWGLEDDEFYVRLRDAGIHILRPENISTGQENSFRHIHDRNIRERDTKKCFNQREVTRKRDRKTGLNDVSYKIQSVQQLKIDNAHLKVLNIQLNCDRSATPWCTCNPLHPSKEVSPQNSAKS